MLVHGEEDGMDSGAYAAQQDDRVFEGDSGVSAHLELVPADGGNYAGGSFFPLVITPRQVESAQHRADGQGGSLHEGSIGGWLRGHHHHHHHHHRHSSSSGAHEDGEDGSHHHRHHRHHHHASRHRSHGDDSDSEASLHSSEGHHRHHHHRHHHHHRSSSRHEHEDVTEEHASTHHHHHHHHHGQHHHRHHHHQEEGDSNALASHSQQHLLAVGSRQWGSNNWWDSRSLLKVKIYDFAIYADAAKVQHALQQAGVVGSRPAARRALPAPGTADFPALSPFSGTPSELLKSPASHVPASLTIRACRPLPLQLLGQEFERILQRRTEKAGGSTDDPALAELLSYFTAARLPRHVITEAGDAVRKGAAITFSRSASGEMVTEAGGAVLGVVRSAPVVEALFDLYLGDQPVSKKAKAAAGESLLRLAAGAPGSELSVRYVPANGERLQCRGGGLDSCVVEL